MSAAEADFKILIDHLPDNVILHRGGRIVFVNRATLAYLGYEHPEDLLGQPLAKIIHPEDHGLLVERIDDILGADGVAAPIEERLLHRSGAVLTAEFVGRRVVFEGQPTVLAVARDATERKDMQARLMLSDRMASVGTLAAGVAHEINNPLAFVMFNLTTVSEEVERLSEDYVHDGVLAGRLSELGAALREAREGAERVKQIVRELKAFSRPDDQRRGPVELRPAIESAINMAYNQIKLRARLIKDYGETPPVEANEARLCQAFLNLFVNAAQAIPEGQAAKNAIRVTTRAEGDGKGRVTIEIRDTGCGIEPGMLARIWDPFFTTKPMGVGTGLGLSICHGIITGFGGEISVESEVGKGTCFRVALPAAKAEVSEVRAAPAPAQPAVRRASILVIDDEPMICSAVRRALGADHDVLAVASAREALDHLASGARFDVILCDLMMPEMTGMDLHDELSRTAPQHVEHLIFVTGGAFTPRARTFLDAVPNQRLEKPFDMKSLRALIRDRVR